MHRAAGRIAAVGALVALACTPGCERGDSDRKKAGGPDIDGTPIGALLAQDARRLTRREYGASVQAVTGTSLDPADGFPPDARQQGYTVNQAQIVDTLLVKQLATSAKKIAADMRPRFDQLAPCPDAASAGRSCAEAFILSFGSAVVRRPMNPDEVEGLLAVYDVGATDGYADGIELVVRALLQSAGMLYLTALGEDAGDGAALLDPYEIASNISYLTTGGPPDAELLGAAASGALEAPEAREAHASRLLATSAGHDRVVTLVEEWLELDRLRETAKDTTVYQPFADAKPSMINETHDFVVEVLANDGSVSDLLGADWSVTEPALATFYGVSGAGRVELPARRGLLNRGAFLAVHAHATETAPVLRGVTVLRRVGCFDVASPSTLNIDVIPPPPDPTQTTRERYTVHSADAGCAACHHAIDPIGFSFEGFDGMGGVRPGGLDNGKPVDTSATVTIYAGFDGSFADSNELAAALAASPEVRRCFARHLFRGTTGYSGADSTLAEEQFVTEWGADADAEQGRLAAAILASVRSPLFSHRRITP